MAATTPRFGLNYFGGATPGNLDEDGGKYTSEDRLAIDRLLSALETHDHRVPTKLPIPDQEPDLLLVEGGSLPAGETYYYVLSFVNKDGLESVHGPEVSIDTPDILEEPDPPTIESTTGGTLGEGEYYYAITGIRGVEESIQSEPVAATVVAGDDAVLLTLPEYGDAEQYQIWRMKETDASWTRIDKTDQETYLDDGSVPSGEYGDPENVPPLVNEGISNYGVQITLTGNDADEVQQTAGWRIYRTDVSGAYSSMSLVHEVVEHTNDLDESSPRVVSWIDDGDATLVGSPKIKSTELDQLPFSFETADTLPDPDDYPNGYPVLVGQGTAAIFYIRTGGTKGLPGYTPVWTPISGGLVRGAGFFTGHGAPSPEPDAALAGDLYLDLDTGDLYELDGA